MLRLGRFCDGARPTMTSWSAQVARRLVSTRQAERLRRSTSGPSMPGATPAMRTGPRPAPASGLSSRRASAKRGPSASVKPPPSSTAAPPRSSSAASSTARGKALPGRFNRLVVSHGFSVTMYHYVVGESINLSLTYLLYTHRFGIGDIGSWIAALGVPAERVLDVGPRVYGVRLSPRLLLDYLLVNACTYPTVPLQLRMCMATAPFLFAPFRLLLRLTGGGKKASVAKAPAAAP